MSGVVHDRRMPVRVKSKVYKTMIRPLMVYGAETLTLRKIEEQMLEHARMRMLQCILGLTTL